MDPDNPAGREQAAVHSVVYVTRAAWRAHGAFDATDDAVDLPLDFPPAAEPPPATPDDGPQRALHDERLWQLARRGQGTVLTLEFELQSRLARQAFRRDFAYVSRQLLGLEASRRVQGLDRLALDDAIATVRHRADELAARLARLADELDALPVSARAADAVFAQAAPARLRATVLSPSARRFIELLQAVDRVVCRVERAWLLGLLPPPRRTAIVGECRRALVGFKELARERRHAIGLQVRAVNARGSPPAPVPPSR